MVNEIPFTHTHTKYADHYNVLFDERKIRSIRKKWSLFSHDVTWDWNEQRIKVTLISQSQWTSHILCQSFVLILLITILYALFCTKAPGRTPYINMPSQFNRKYCIRNVDKKPFIVTLPQKYSNPNIKLGKKMHFSM